MTVRVLGFSDATQFDREPRFLELAGDYHLFATPSLLKGWRSSEVSRAFPGMTLITTATLVDFMISTDGSWKRARTKLEQVSSLVEVLEERIQAAPADSEEEHRLKALRRGRPAVAARGGEAPRRGPASYANG